MSAQLKRDLSAQQRTIRNQAVLITRLQRAIDNALPMILAGHYAQAEKDLRSVSGGGSK